MIALKGSPKGIMITIDEEDLELATRELSEKIVESSQFFNEETLEVFLTSNVLTEAEVFSLRSVVSAGLSNTRVIFIEEPPRLLPKQHSPLDDLSMDEGVTKFVRTTVKSGEVLKYEHNLIIIGDVERGATVVAGGNIFILGSLLGTACAGSNGKADSVIVAMRLMAENIEIAGLSQQVKAGVLKKLLPGVPEIAYIMGSEIKIEQYT